MEEMVNACECRWSKKEVKALIAFLLAEKRRHQRDIRNIEMSIENLKREYNLSERDIEECDDFAYYFIHF